MRKFLQANSQARASGQLVLAGIASEVASAASQDAAAGVAAIDNMPPPIVEGLTDLWAAVGEDDQPLEQEEVEELVLAHLCEYPPFLTEVLLDAPVHHVAIGQGLLVPSDRQVDVVEVSRRLAPCLQRHRATASKVATEACSRLLQRSETLAHKLFNRLDLNGDGVICRDEF